MARRGTVEDVRWMWREWRRLGWGSAKCTIEADRTLRRRIRRRRGKKGLTAVEVFGHASADAPEIVEEPDVKDDGVDGFQGQATFQEVTFENLAVIHVGADVLCNCPATHKELHDRDDQTDVGVQKPGTHRLDPSVFRHSPMPDQLGTLIANFEQRHRGSSIISLSKALESVVARVEKLQTGTKDSRGATTFLSILAFFAFCALSSPCRGVDTRTDNPIEKARLAELKREKREHVKN